MQVLQIIEEAQSGAAYRNLARTLGITEAEARAAVDAALPELTRAIERNTLSRGGLADFIGALGHGHHEYILETPASWTDPRVVADGQAILAHVMGSQEKAEVLAARTAQASGLGTSIIEMLLPILAQWVMGAIARYAKGGLGDILSRLPIPGGQGGDTSRSETSPRRRGGFDTGGTMGDGGGFELPRSDIPAGGYPMPPIPGSADDSPAPSAPVHPSRRPGGFELPWPSGGGELSDDQDRPRTGSGFDLPKSGPPPGGYPMPPIPPASDSEIDTAPTRGGGANPFPFPFPFPLPGSGERRPADNPYGDLSDILRRGGSLPAGDRSGNGLWSVVRSVIGSALGFGNRGIFGWLIRLVVMRWGWSLLRRIFLGR
ncbi:MAG: DUF937 domain-containing protein [Hyphomicrobiaceae bacterium]